MTDDELREGLLRLRNVAREEGGHEDELLLIDVLDALADRLLGPPGHDALHESSGHRLHVDAGEWGLVHPFSCRPDLTGCAVHKAVAAQMRGDDPLEEGVYHVRAEPDGALTAAAQA